MIPRLFGLRRLVRIKRDPSNPRVLLALERWYVYPSDTLDMGRGGMLQRQESNNTPLVVKLRTVMNRKD